MVLSSIKKIKNKKKLSLFNSLFCMNFYHFLYFFTKCKIYIFLSHALKGILVSKDGVGGVDVERTCDFKKTFYFYRLIILVNIFIFRCPVNL